RVLDGHRGKVRERFEDLQILTGELAFSQSVDDLDDTDHLIAGAQRPRENRFGREPRRLVHARRKAWIRRHVRNEQGLALLRYPTGDPFAVSQSLTGQQLVSFTAHQSKD